MMNIAVEYIDRARKLENKTYTISRLAFAKHFAIVGQGFSPKPQKLLRTIGMFIHYSQYLRRQEFNNENRFSEPPIELSDPTEKGQFSNLAGKAIADYLSKQIDGSIFTVNYEAAMRIKRMRLNVGRPDLLAYTKDSMFAIEAKGYSGGSGDMNNHKSQSQTGGIPVNFTVACVSHNLYNQVRCNYHDPFNGDVPFDLETFKILTKNYYSGLAEFTNEKYFRTRTVEYYGQEFYEVELYSRYIKQLFGDEYLLTRHLERLFRFRTLKLILPVRVQEYAEYGISTDTSFSSINIENGGENIYIDRDGVGLSLVWLV